MRAVPLVLAVVLLAAGAWGYWAQPALTDYGVVAWHQRLLHPIATNRAVQSLSTRQAFVSADGSRALIAGDGTLLESADGGVRWRRVAGVDRNLMLSAVAASADGRRIVAFDPQGIIIRSLDGGTSWSATRLDKLELWHIALSADGMRGLITAHEGDKPAILRTADGGETWTRLATAPKATFDVAMSGDGMRAIVKHLDKQETALAYSADGGATWTEQVIATARLQDVGVSADGLTGYAGGFGGALMQTSDGGATWRLRPFDTNLDVRCLSVSADGRRVAVIARHASEAQVLQLSEDGGATWRAVPVPMTAWSFLNGVALSADGRTGLIIGTGGGPSVWRSADGGRTWQPLTTQTQAAWWIYGAAALAVILLGMALWPRRSLASIRMA